ncbi:MAG TPA: tRNA (guanosine(46)-N7)-methyltransferase TrmB [Woeseiaceae bacterium]|nr:tRNA (guanosine(46)-N7)-methyltransferase TrmB [Woeseiaceae bacterium]
MDARPHRKVRSFVRRPGRITAAQQRALDSLLPRFAVAFEARRVDLDAAFGRAAPRVLDIGFGDGEALVSTAAAHPEIDYLGVEVHEPGVGHLLIMLERARLENVRVIVHDAVEVIGTMLPDAAFAAINLFFPDPWPKKRHHKRRLVQPRFLALAAAALEPGGTLRIATDWHNYAEHIDEVIAQSDAFTVTERREHAGDRPLDRLVTRFERRGLAQGHRITDWCLTRKR